MMLLVELTFRITVLILPFSTLAREIQFSWKLFLMSSFYPEKLHKESKLKDTVVVTAALVINKLRTLHIFFIKWIYYSVTQSQWFYELRWCHWLLIKCLWKEISWNCAISCFSFFIFGSMAKFFVYYWNNLFYSKERFNVLLECLVEANSSFIFFMNFANTTLCCVFLLFKQVTNF